MRKLLAVLFLAVAPVWAFGQNIEVKTENRVKNQTGVQCMWSSMETLARHHGYTQLYKVTETKKGPAFLHDALNEMCRVGGVDFVAVQGPVFESIESAVKEGSPVAVCIITGPRSRHCLVVSGVDRKAGTMTVIDNGGPKALEDQTWKIDDFMRVYAGECFYLKKKK
jgi:hypothetical protein